MATTKECPSCGETKPVSDFGRNRTLGDGLSFYCLTCSRQRSNAWYREHRRRQGHEIRDHSWVPDGFRWCPSCRQAVAHHDYVRNSRTASGFGGRCKACHNAANSAAYFYRQYKLTPRGVAELRAAQDDRCAICGDPGPQHLDHDHSTGEIRQLLCQRCNHGLGLFRDDPGLLHLAAFYVEGHGQRQTLDRLAQWAADAPDGASRPDIPPVGSRRRQDGRGSSSRTTGRSSGTRRRKPAGEADA